ncbi:MAG: BrnT family toxin [Candidatus Binatia bacterium]
MSDPAAERWLIALTGAAEEFEWDTGNLTKNRKHGVEPADVQALIGGDLYLAGRIAEPAHEEPRWLVLGEDAAGRRLALVFTRRGNRLRPISCRAMRRKEKALYEEARRQAD